MSNTEEEYRYVLSLNKTIAKVGGFRIGIGTRITKKNASYMWLVLIFVLMFQLMWYMVVASLWLMYAMLYATVWCFKKFVQFVVWIINLIKDNNNKKVAENPIRTEVITAQTSEDSTTEVKYCKECGAELNGGKFCSNCGAEVK